uniref:Si:dkey-4c23.3 n=1 Tax=Cyprinus carpio TaxID=7962 RepID=A0A8C1M8D2_CYPCA
LPVFGNQILLFPMRVQVGAVLALKVIAKKEPKLVQNVVLQIFVNKDLHPELRMVSWIVLFETKPNMGLVITLARALQKEPNLQVASLVYSHMKALTRSTHPDAAASRVAIKILSPKLDKLSFRYSKAFLLDGYEVPLMVGAAGSAFFINDAATILPRAVVTKARAYLAGAAADILEVGVRTDGIQEALLKSPFVHEDRLPRMKQVLKAVSVASLPNKQPLGSIYVKVLGQEIAFANVDKAVLEQAIIPELAGEALKAMQNGTAFQYAKPLLVAEVRHIFPSVAGVPMEFSLYAAAVAAGNLKVQAIITPPLTETISVSHLMKTDVKLTAEVSPSITLQTFAVMGLNTGFIQAASMAKGKIHTFLPLKVEAKFDITKANFKIKAFPIVLPVHALTARFETLAAAGNIKALNAERITPIVPETVVLKHSQEAYTSMITPGDLSSETIKTVMSPAEEPELRTSVPVHKTLCSVVPHIGVNVCMEIMSCDATFIKNTTIYNMIGQHGVHINIVRGKSDGPAVEGLELEVQLGPKAAKKLLKEISFADTKTPKVKAVLQKLRKVLEGEKMNKNSSFFSHNKLFYSQSTSSHSFSSSSSVRSSKSHLSKVNIKLAKYLLDIGDGYALLSLIIQTVCLKLRNKKKKNIICQSQCFKSRFLGDSVPPVVAIIARVVRVDRKLLGYQLTAYLDMPTSRVQIIVVSIAVKNNWKMCADGVLLSKHNAGARIAWGAECQQYAITINAVTGHQGPSPMAYLKVKCEKVPTIITNYAKSVAEYISNAAQMTGLAISNEKNIERQIELIILVPTERTLDIIIKTPTVSYNLMIGLLCLFLTAFSKICEFADDLVSVELAKCSKVRNTLTTFNHKKYNYEIPLSCNQVLVQDCTSEHKFIVLIKKDDVFEHEDLNIKVADIDVDIYHQKSAVKVKMNGIEIPTNNISYQHPTGTIRIEQKGQGIALYAPGHGLQEVYYTSDQWMVYVVDWMKGQTCGLCGKADGEIRQEYTTPSGDLTKSSVSFAHSWVLPVESCRDASQCHMKLESEKLEKQVILNGQESKCYSVEPVLRCLPGCVPIRTTPVTIGYHCMSTDTNLNMFDGIYEKSVDLRETTDAHVACRCTEQCA